MKITVWNEHIHERKNPEVQEIYPEGIHRALVKGLEPLLENAEFRTATLAEEDHGLKGEDLDSTDVLLWWGHLAHDQVSDEVLERVHNRVLHGMGLIVLHSAHLSRVFRRLMGTSCNLRWREADDRELLWTVNPQHPIAAGVEFPIELERHEMYGEFFDIPQPDELVFVSSFSGGEVFRSGCCFQRGKGRVFYFSPGHETYPVYRHPDVLKVLSNAVRWACQPEISKIETATSPNAPTDWWR